MPLGFHRPCVYTPRYRLNASLVYGGRRRRTNRGRNLAETLGNGLFAFLRPSCFRFKTLLFSVRFLSDLFSFPFRICVFSYLNVFACLNVRYLEFGVFLKHSPLDTPMETFNCRFLRSCVWAIRAAHIRLRVHYFPILHQQRGIVKDVERRERERDSIGSRTVEFPSSGEMGALSV